MTDDRAARRRAWLKYTGLRLLCFLVPLGVVWALSANLLLSAAVAAVIGLCLSVILLGRQREAVVAPMAERRSRQRADEDVEDEALDAGDQNASAAPRPRA